MVVQVRVKWVEFDCEGVEEKYCQEQENYMKDAILTLEYDEVPNEHELYEDVVDKISNETQILVESVEYDLILADADGFYYYAPPEKVLTSRLPRWIIAENDRGEKVQIKVNEDLEVVEVE